MISLLLLQPLIKVMVADTSVAEAFRRLDALDLTLVDSSFDQWDAELRALNVTRAQTTNSLVFVHDKSLALGNELGNPRGAPPEGGYQRGTLHGRFERTGNQRRNQTACGEVREQPPKAVPSCLEQRNALLHMESIDSTRKQVAAHALTFIRAFKRELLRSPHLRLILRSLTAAQSSKPLSKLLLTSLWKQKIWYQVSKSNCSQFLEKLIAASKTRVTHTKPAWRGSTHSLRKQRILVVLIMEAAIW